MLLIENFVISETKGTIIVSKEKLDSTDKGFGIELHINQLYMPSKIWGGNDYRTLGIGVIC